MSFRIACLALVLASCEGNRNDSDVVRAATVRASLATDGREANGASGHGCVSDDGRYVAFESDAKNLVPGALPQAKQIYLRDLEAKTTMLVSVSTSGGPGGGASEFPSISADGRYVAFASAAANLVSEGLLGFTDVFVRDVAQGVTVRVSVGLGGAEANGHSYWPAISANGDFVAFTSSAANLVSGDSNSQMDVFRVHRSSLATARVSVQAGGNPAEDGDSWTSAISSNGNLIAFASDRKSLTSDDDNGGTTDVFLRDVGAGTTILISRASASGGVDGVKGNGASGGFVSGPVSLASGGGFVAFYSEATNLVPGGGIGIFVRDVAARRTERVSVGAEPGISGDGRFVVWSSDDPDLVPGDTNGRMDAFVRDRDLGITVRLSVRTYGGEAASPLSPFVVGESPAISSNGRYAVFESSSINLAEDDTNGLKDVYRRGPLY